jgi:TolB-like protein
MKRFIALAAMLLLAGFCFGQNTLVVVPLQNRGDRALNADVETITELLGNAVARTQRFDVVDRAALEDVMREHQFQMDDWSSDSKSVEMGRVLNANFIVRGQVSRLGPNLIVTARILDVNTARILGTSEMQLVNVGEAYEKMGDFVRTLTGNIRTTSSSTRQPTQNQPAQGTAGERDTNAEDAWKHKWIYLGGILGGGSYSRHGQWGDVTAPLLVAGFQADFCLLSFLSVGLGLYLGVDIKNGEILPVIPLLVKLGGKFGKVELTGDVGYTIGAGLTIGATFGVNVGPGILFAEVGFIPVSSFDTSIFIGYLGYKVGLVEKK